MIRRSAGRLTCFAAAVPAREEEGCCTCVNAFAAALFGIFKLFSGCRVVILAVFLALSAAIYVFLQSFTKKD